MARFARVIAKKVEEYDCNSFISLQQARLAQSVEHQTFNLRVEGWSPSLGDSCFLLES